jgi:hypothetical protein
MINPWAVTMWYVYLTNLLGSCNSMESWSSALTWFCEMLDLTVKPKPRHQNHNGFVTFRKNLVGACTKKKKEKSPCNAMMIVIFLKLHLNVMPGHFLEASYTDLWKAFLIVLAFIGAFRPSELVYSETKEELCGMEYVRVKGLKWKHIEILNRPEARGGRMMRITIPLFKNQRDETTPLVKTFATPMCDPNNRICKGYCAYFDTFGMYEALKTMRENVRVDPRPFNRFRSETPIEGERLQNLGTRPNDFVFVNTGGKVVKYEQMRRVVQELVTALGLDTKVIVISAHSFRVGSSSTAYIQGIACLAFCKWVEWSVENIRCTQAQYIKLMEEQLSDIPFDLLHGAVVQGVRVNYIGTTPAIWVIAREVIEDLLYGGSGSKKMRKAKVSKVDWSSWGRDD